VSEHRGSSRGCESDHSRSIHRHPMRKCSVVTAYGLAASGATHVV
jgi:hypothetical protein